MSFVVKAIVYMTASEFDAVEVKRGDILYVVDYGDRLRSYLGDIPVESLTFSDFTQDQIDEIKSAAQEAAEASAAVAVQAAEAASASENATKGYMDNAKVYADKAALAEGYDESARKAAVSALNAATSANTSLLRTIAERVLAQSYAIGGTNTRPGEDTDNAKYYMRRAQAAAEGVDQDFSYIESIKDHVDEQSAHVDDVAQTTEGYMDAAEASKQAAETAQGKAETAQGKAEDAQGAAEAAQQAAETAQGKAEDAQQAAETAQGKAEDAQSKAEIAQGKAEDAQQAAETAQAAAETAQGKAEDAQDAAEGAQTAAETAQGKAEDAQMAAETAQGKAEDAQQAAETAKSLAETAQGKAEDAQQAAETANSLAETAQGKAEDAKQAAEDAQGAAEDAQGAAETAQGKAEDAQQAAETAQGEADGSATAAAASAKLSESWAVGGTGVRDGENTNNAAYWAEEARKLSPDGKADKVLGGDTDGMVAGLDATGNLTNTEIPSGNVAQKDGYYGKEGLGAATAENLIDPNATPEPATFGFRTAAGDLSITDGKGVVHTQFGSTEIVNQIVAPSSVKTVQGEGVVQVADAVGGQVKGLALTAPRSVVLNQQATATQDVTATGDGVAQLENAAAGNATALRMTAPRSVVVNQLVQNGDFSNGTTGWDGVGYGTLSVSNNVCYFTLVSNALAARLQCPINVLKGHTYIIQLTIKAAKDTSILIGVSSNLSAFGYQSISAGVTTTYSNRVTITDNADLLYLYCNRSQTLEVGDIVEYSNIMLVDLTQYFNGDQTLIDSITSWDDLVAYDPRFASYVEYNTGTVEGVQPTVKVSGKNLFDQSRFLTEVTRCTLTQDGYYTAPTANFYAIYYINNGSLLPSSAFKQGVQYTVRALGYGNRTDGANFYITIFHTDGTHVNSPGTTSTATEITITSTQGKTVNRICFTWGGGNTSYIKDVQIEIASSATPYEPYYAGGTVQAPAPLFAVGTAADEFEAVSGVTTRNARQVTLPATGWNTYGFSTWKGFSCLNVLPVAENRPFYISSNSMIPGIPKGTTHTPNNIVHAWIGVNGTTSVFVAWNENVTPPAAWLTDGEPDVNKFMTWLAANPVTLCYATSSPTTSQSTPTQISLQAGSNVAMQTDGGRTASLSATYPATVYDKAILPSRTYLHKHGSTVVKISSQSTVTLDGSDQLVDLTQLFNNDTTTVAAVNTWDDLVARVPAYAATMAYNPGAVTGTVPAVRVTGKNLLNINRPVGTLTSGASPTNRSELSDDYVYLGLTFGNHYYPNRVASYTIGADTCSGVTGSPANCGLSYPVRVKANTQYTISCLSLNGKVRMSFYTSSGVYITTNEISIPANVTYTTFTTPVDCSIVLVTMYSSEVNTAWEVVKPQLELGSVATAYEPYHDGGTATSPSELFAVGSAADEFEAVSGKLTHKFKSVDMGTLNWYDNSTYGGFYAYLNTDALSRGEMICPKYVYVGIFNNLADKTLAYIYTRAVIVQDSAYSDAATFKTAMSGVMLYYELATPTEESSTPQPVSFQQGNNVIAQSSQDLPGVAISAGYDGTEYDLKLVNGSKYVIVDNGVAAYRTASSSNNTLPVHGGSTMVHNLTQWFGKGYEPVSVDAFYSRYPSLKGYAMPYNRGSVLNYKGTAVRTEGFNFYNPATGTARLLGGHQYQICGTYASCSYADRWGNAEELDIDEEGIFTPVNNGTLTVVGGNATDTCVHLTWSGYRNFGKDEYQWEPFWQVTTPLNVLDSFPEGMNGIQNKGTGTTDVNVRDELTVTGYVKRIEVVDGGDLTYNNYNDGSAAPAAYPWGYCSFGIPGKKAGDMNMQCPYYTPVTTFTSQNKSILATRTNTTCYIVDSSFIGLTGEQIKERMTGVKIYFETATPVSVTFPETRLITYPVSDFGTEELLPADDEPGIPSTTWLDGLIQYEQDFLRLLINFSKIYSVLKHIADNADHIVYDDDTAPNLIAGNAWNLIDREARGTMREFSYDSVNGTNDVTDGTAIAQSVQGQTLMANQLVQDSVVKTAQGTGQVEVEDAVAGDISSLVVEGRSLVKNQLVPPTMTNTKNSSNGRLGITDGVAGNAVGVTLRGGCVVHNQLVKESVEKIVTGTGRLGCEDGVAGDAKSLVMTAPRSVVMNQLVTPRASAEEVYGLTRVNNNNGSIRIYGTCTSRDNFTLTINFPVIQNHVYAAFFMGASSYTNGLIVFLAQVSSTYFVKVTANNSLSSSIALQVTNGDTIDLTIFPMCVDLTQYFNGDTARINSIQTWDDLVAYDSSFASYVPYNTGTVQGVTPSVKVNHATDVACPVELFGVDDTVGDSFDGVSGVVTRRIGVVDLGTLKWEGYHEPSDNYPNGYTTTILLSKQSGTTNFICPVYPYSTSGSANKVIRGNSSNGRIIIQDSALLNKTSEELTSALSGIMLYYELATPTTEQYTPTTIPTVDIYNCAIQTAGTRQCSLSLTYDGREQTIALDPTHTYVFLDNMTDSSLITEQSSIDAVGGEDMLVDVTQLYNGDSTKISQIKRWASLSTRFHRYRELLPYNPGTVEPDTPVVRVFPNEHAYGAVYDPSLSSPTLKWVELNNGVITEKASFEEFSSTPCHDIWRCVMDDLATRHVNYYLDDNDSDKKYNGTRLGVTSDGSASVLTGEDGDVMSRFPVSHWYMDEDYEGEGKVLWLISDRPFMGTWAPSEIHDFFYVGSGGSTPSDQFVGSFKAVVCDEDGVALNTTEGALAQATGTAATNKVRSVAGALPYVNANLDTMETRARRNGGHMTNTKFLQWLTLLMVIEEGTLNTQAEHAGYSNGINNAFCFWRKSGRVNAGNGTAEIFAEEDSQDMDNFQSLKVGSTTVQRDTLMDADGRYAWSIYNRGASSTRYFTDSPTPANGDTVYSESTGDTTAGTVSSYTIRAASARAIQFQYRGIENPFGETWTFEHGIQVYNDAALSVIRVDNVNYTRDPSMDGPASRAFVHEGEYRWVGLTLPSNAHAFLDADLTQDSGYVATGTYLKYNNGYWETLDTDAYTMTAQQTAANPAYTWRAFPWAVASGWVRKFDPATFFAITVGGSASTYLPDYYYTTTNGSRVVYLGGVAYNGSGDGMAFRNVSNGLTGAAVYISGRLSA